MSEEVRTVLMRLKRRISRERARCDRIEKAATARNDAASRERAFGEANVLSMTMKFIDEEIKKWEAT